MITLRKHFTSVIEQTKLNLNSYIGFASNMCTTFIKILAKSCWNVPCYWKTPTSTMYQFCINYQLHSKQDSDFSLLKPLKVYKYIDKKVRCTSWMFSMHGNFLGVHHKLVKMIHVIQIYPCQYHVHDSTSNTNQCY